MIPEKDMHDLKSLSRATRGGTLDPERLAVKAYRMGSAACHAAIALNPIDPQPLNMAALERLAYARAFEQAGSVIDAAKLLGVGKTTAYRKAREYGITTRKAPMFCPNCGRLLCAALPAPLHTEVVQ